jgi:hypothetical protein
MFLLLKILLLSDTLCCLSVHFVIVLLLFVFEITSVTSIECQLLALARTEGDQGDDACMHDPEWKKH